jgi:dCTP deaminase
MLSDGDLAHAILDHELIVSPFDPMMIQPASIDLRLGRTFRVFRDDRVEVIDPAVEQPGVSELIQVGPGNTLLLEPGYFVLAHTLETVELGLSLAGRVEGKSSLGRLGLEVHRTAGFIDPGFRGSITLEMSNIRRRPLRLHPGMKIAQLCAFRLTSPASTPYGAQSYGSRYQDQSGPTESLSWRNFRTWPELLGETP